MLSLSADEGRRFEPCRLVAVRCELALARGRSPALLWEILCSSNRVTVSVHIVRVFSFIEHQVFFITTSRCNRLVVCRRRSASTHRRMLGARSQRRDLYRSGADIPPSRCSPLKDSASHAPLGGGSGPHYHIVRPEVSPP